MVRKAIVIDTDNFAPSFNKLCNAVDLSIEDLAYLISKREPTTLNAIITKFKIWKRGRVSPTLRSFSPVLRQTNYVLVLMPKEKLRIKSEEK